MFRPREKERYKLRKHRKNDVDAFRKLQQLRRDFETARDLCALARRRETVSRLRGDASRGRLQRALDTLSEARGASKRCQTKFPFADQDDDYRLTPNEVAAATKALADAEAAKKAQAQLPVGLGVPVVTAPGARARAGPGAGARTGHGSKAVVPRGRGASLTRAPRASVALRPLEKSRWSKTTIRRSEVPISAFWSCGAFTPSTRVVSIESRRWVVSFLVRTESRDHDAPS